MNNILLLVVGAVVVVGGGYFLYTNMSGGSGGETMMEEEHVDSGERASGTLAALMASGQNLECTFSYDDGTNVSSGTVYMTAGASRIRGDFNITESAGGAMEVHMIRDGGYNYLWGSALPQGIKTKITVENEGKLFDSETGSVDENTQFDCFAWDVDESKFRLPAGVEFMDLSAAVPSMQGAPSIQEGRSNMKDIQCSACDQAPAGAAREQCRLALGCN